MLATVAQAARERWTTTDELLAGLIEVVDFGNRMFHAAYSEDDVPDPVQINRPTDRAEAESRPATAAEMKAFFGGSVEYTP